MDKLVDLNESVYELSKQFPEIPQILAGLGFQDILKPGMLSTAGRFMTIIKGAKLKGIDLGEIEKTLKEHGFEIKEGLR